VSDQAGDVAGLVVFALRHDQRKRHESAEDLRPSSRAAKPLEELLKNQAGGENRSFALESFSQEGYARTAVLLIPA
jgi:hypothetical protein